MQWYLQNRSRLQVGKIGRGMSETVINSDGIMFAGLVIHASVKRPLSEFWCDKLEPSRHISAPGH